MRALLLKLIAAIVLVALVEIAFQAGLWERLAKPDSHAGTSVRLKRALSDPSVPRIDFVTLGSSRPAFGLDHARIAAAAREHGFVHADLSMPGSHWMTIGILGDWLTRHHPETRSAIIALAIQDFAWPGNGSYELGIVQPFRRIADIPWMERHVAFQRDDVETWGVYSALFAWRQDIQSFVASPSARLKSLRWFARNRGTQVTLFDNPSSQGDMCAIGLGSLAACDRADASTDPALAGLKRQCVEIRGAVAGYATRMNQAPTSDALAATQTLIRNELRDAHWSSPPLVVLMPVPKIWRGDGIQTSSLHEWALHVLKPLADEGRIHVIDATGFFDADPDEGCSAFFDFYHQNAEGRERFTQWLLPHIEQRLFVPAMTSPGIASH